MENLSQKEEKVPNEKPKKVSWRKKARDRKYFKEDKQDLFLRGLAGYLRKYYEFKELPDFYFEKRRFEFVKELDEAAVLEVRNLLLNWAYDDEFNGIEPSAYFYQIKEVLDQKNDAFWDLYDDAKIKSERHYPLYEPIKVPGQASSINHY